LGGFRKDGVDFSASSSARQDLACQKVVAIVNVPDVAISAPYLESLDRLRSKQRGTSRCRAAKAESTKALYTGMDEQARRQRPSLLKERLGLASFTEKNPFRTTPHQSSPSLAPHPGPISNKNFESKQFSSLFLLFFLLHPPPRSINRHSKLTNRDTAIAASPSHLALGESPRTSPSRRSLRKRAAIEAQRLTSAPRPSPCGRPCPPLHLPVWQLDSHAEPSSPVPLDEDMSPLPGLQSSS